MHGRKKTTEERERNEFGARELGKERVGTYTSEDASTSASKFNRTRYSDQSITQDDIS
jgi:hypothetical protein